MSRIKSPEELDVNSLNPNDPRVYTNPELCRFLDPRQQMIAAINMAETGQMVQGNQIRTMEAILAGAGYTVQFDGVLSSDEIAAMKNFKEKLEDTKFKQTALTLLGTIAGVATMDALLSPDADPNVKNALTQLSQWVPRPGTPAPGF